MSFNILRSWRLKESGREDPTFQKSNEIEKVNPLTINVPYHIETSQLICNANQLTGFHMMGNTDD